MDSKKILTEADVKTKVISWIVLAILLMTCWYMLNLAVLTFILAFVFYHLLTLIVTKLKKMGIKRVPERTITIILYTIFAATLIMLGTKAVPAIALQVAELGRIIYYFDIKELEAIMDPRLYTTIMTIDFARYINSLGTWMLTVGTKVGEFSFNIFLSFVLSLAILIEKETIKRFGQSLENSKVSYIYRYCSYFGGSFAKSFGKVMKVQVTIAFVNCIISMIALTVMGFPQIPALGIMIFLLGLVPVAGAFVSLIPLCIIAFNIGGIMKVIAVLIMIAIIHTLEAYVLNPKLMSNKTKLPVCLVFIILVVGEHYLGPWGLLIGVPIFIFLMDIVDVKYGEK